jgi:transmembrane sensor
MPEAGNIDVIANLIVSYLQNELDNEGKEQLQQWIDSSPDRKEWFDKISDPDYLIRELQLWQNAGVGEQELWTKVQQRLNSQPYRTGRLYWMRIAAVLFLLAGIAAGVLWFTRNDNKKTLPVIVQTKPADVQPGGFKAKLTLADGSTIILDSVAVGKLTSQGNATIINKGGALHYSSSTGAGRGEAVFNTLSTNKGEIYSLTLSDGSRVWLNSASSIRYPVAFSGDERKVEITGEAYFEVAHDAQKPFKVMANGIETQVLGTKFNINAYSDEKVIKTTLLVGKVKVSTDVKGETVVLKPGEQAVLEPHSPLTTHHSPDLDEVMAWKNGLFIFNEAPLDVVMRQISRWYDVEVSYGFDNRQKPINVTGQISRFSNARKVLDMLAATGWLQFKIEGKKIVVNKQ